MLPIKGFTIAHSITLALSALELVRLHVPPVEAAIALSIVFVAVEMARGKENSLTFRYPIAVSTSFGLLHGFGFASGLTAMGLPTNEIPLALLFFNVGVELGQLAFVFLMLALARSFRTLEIRWPRWAELVPGYAVGTLGALWFIERTAILMGWM